MVVVVVLVVVVVVVVVGRGVVVVVVVVVVVTVELETSSVDRFTYWLHQGCLDIQMNQLISLVHWFTLVLTFWTIWQQRINIRAPVLPMILEKSPQSSFVEPPAGRDLKNLKNLKNLRQIFRFSRGIWQQRIINLLHFKENILETFKEPQRPPKREPCYNIFHDTGKGTK